MKYLLLLAGLNFALYQSSTAQILCVLCYDQNDSISTGVNNLIQNGGFENTPCVASTGVIGENTSWCQNSNGYSCDFAGWTSSGGGTSSYSCLYNTVLGKSIIIQGNNAVYFGNFYANACSAISDDTSCLINLGCTATGIPAGYPFNPDPAFGGSTGLSLQQTVSGLIPGNVYVLEFWAGGEEYYGSQGLFALDVGFGDTLLRCKSTGPGQTGLTYIIQFKANAPSHTIKYTNWGHICGNCTELVLDNVRLYTLAELSASVIPCFTTNIGFGASNTKLCEKFCVSFADSSTNNPTAWQWIFPGGTPSTSTDQNPGNVCYDAPGVYDVTLITTNANGVDTLTLSSYITVYATPSTPTITQAGYTLTSSPSDFYQWQLNTFDIAGATNQSYNVVQTGLYTVVVSDLNGCKNSKNLFVQITGIEEINESRISLYPNPSDGSFVVELSGDLVADVLTINVFNSLGQSIYSSKEVATSPKWKKEIDLSSATPGIYFIEMKSSDFIARKKITISK